MDFEVLILGTDANAYYMARCYHEAYNEKAYVLAKSMLPYTHYSNILNLYYDDSIWTEEGFLKAIYTFKEKIHTIYHLKHAQNNIIIFTTISTYKI